MLIKNINITNFFNNLSFLKFIIKDFIINIRKIFKKDKLF